MRKHRTKSENPGSIISGPRVMNLKLDHDHEDWKVNRNSLFGWLESAQVWKSEYDPITSGPGE